MTNNKGKRSFISLRQSDFNALSQAKSKYESFYGGNTDWSTFLLLLLGLASTSPLFSDWQNAKAEIKPREVSLWPPNPTIKITK